MRDYTYSIGGGAALKFLDHSDFFEWRRLSMRVWMEGVCFFSCMHRGELLARFVYTKDEGGQIRAIWTS